MTTTEAKARGNQGPGRVVPTAEPSESAIDNAGLGERRKAALRAAISAGYLDKTKRSLDAKFWCLYAQFARHPVITLHPSERFITRELGYSEVGQRHRGHCAVEVTVPPNVVDRESIVRPLLKLVEKAGPEPPIEPHRARYLAWFRYSSEWRFYWHHALERERALDLIGRIGHALVPAYELALVADIQER